MQVATRRSQSPLRVQGSGFRVYGFGEFVAAGDYNWLFPKIEAPFWGFLQGDSMLFGVEKGYPYFRRAPEKRSSATRLLRREVAGAGLRGLACRIQP